MSNRETIFICHATPEDNDFVIWLGTRLTLLGYKVWFDKVGLIGGESNFWHEIDNQIRNNSIKFLLVNSKSIYVDSGNLRTGVDKEFALAESLVKGLNIIDYIMILKIDDIPYNNYIGFNIYNQIPFYNNWADGLSSLIKKFDKDNVPKSNQNMSNCLQMIKKEEKYIIKIKPEKFNLNWVEITTLPDYLYIYKFLNETDAKSVQIILNDRVVPRIGNQLISFSENINNFKLEKKQNFNNQTSILNSEDSEVYHIPKQIKINIQDILNKVEINIEEVTNPRYFLTILLRNNIEIFFDSLGLKYYNLSNKNKCFYYESNVNRVKGLKFTHFDKQIRKDLFGRYFNSFWHYGISFFIRYYPILSINLTGHILFSDDGFEIWKDDKKIHTARRKKGKNFYNKQWRDLQIAFLKSIANDNKILIPTESNQFIELSTDLFSLESELGFDEPRIGKKNGN